MKKLFVFNLIVVICLIQPAFSQVTFSDKTDFMTGGQPSSVSIADFNGDGIPDLAVADYSANTVSILLNTTTPGAATPSFSTKSDFETGIGSIFISNEDLNGDGMPDIIVANLDGNNISILLNTTVPGAIIPAFSVKVNLATGTYPSSVSIGDFNGDGKPDLAIANYHSNTISVFLNKTIPGSVVPSFSNEFSFTTGSYPISISIGDFNGDGKLDLAAANQDSTVSVLLNMTDPGASVPTFSVRSDFVTGYSSLSVSNGDLNGDGRPDLAVTNQDNTTSVLLNTTTPGSFAPTFSTKSDFPTGSAPHSICIGDLDGNGMVDFVFVHYYYYDVSVYANMTTPGASTPSFSYAASKTTGHYPYSVSIGDINGDGKLDLVVANKGSSTVSVFLNTTAMGVATPAFSANTDSTTGSNPLSISIGDLNVDGKKDIAVANQGSNTVSVFLNTTTPGASVPTLTAKTDFATDSHPTSVCIDDLNGDGKPDMAVVNDYSSSVSVFLNTTTPGAVTPEFTDKTDFTTVAMPSSVAIGDLNGDGMPDLAVAGGANTVSVLLNTTTPGSLTPSFSVKTDFTTGNAPVFVSISDLNGDGKPDLAVSNSSSNSISILINTTAPGAVTPTFSTKTDFTTGTTPQYIYVGDLNGDGKPDLAVSNMISGSVSVLLNTTSPGSIIPSFTAKKDFTAGSNTMSVSMGDVNGDGKPDLVVTNLTSNYVSVFLNTTIPGDTIPTFSDKTDFTTGNAPICVSLDDLNGDGKKDLVTANYGSNTISVLLNEAVLPPVGVDLEDKLIPSEVGLAQNYPNPFNPSTKISFILNNSEKAQLSVYNLLGQKVKTLFEGIAERQKVYAFDFNASNLASGVYLYRLQTPTRLEVRKMMLMK